jgi:predicted N-formylglutamate amidohydrolase
VITCEHGGNRIPVPYRNLFHAHQALLDSHRGYDPGALIMARALATAFAAPLVASTVSRLLVDLNRSVGHPRLHSEATRKAPSRCVSDIEARLPALSRASRAFCQAGDRGPRPGDPPLFHSFTPS